MALIRQRSNTLDDCETFLPKESRSVAFNRAERLSELPVS
jgi:hypothetical protein